MNIDIHFLKTELRKEVTEKRYIHSLGVAETAKKMAVLFGADPNKAELAGILHDFAKYWPKEKMADVIRNNPGLSPDLLEYNSELWHGPVASVIIQEKFQITDRDVVGAIRYHTSGREEMTVLEKIIYLADYIEPSRDFPGIKKMRKLADKNLNLALFYAFNTTIQYLIQKNQKIYPLTVKARNSLMDEIEKNNETEGFGWD